MRHTAPENGKNESQVTEAQAAVARCARGLNANHAHARGPNNAPQNLTSNFIPCNKSCLQLRGAAWLRHSIPFRLENPPQPDQRFPIRPTFSPPTKFPRAAKRLGNGDLASVTTPRKRGEVSHPGRQSHTFTPGKQTNISKPPELPGALRK